MFDAGMEWKDVTGNAAAWDAFFWLAGMMVLAEQITEYGVAQVVGEVSRKRLVL